MKFHKSKTIKNKNDENKRKSLGKIVHEFKTPLLTIISVISKIKEKLEINEQTKIKSELNQIDNLSNYSFFLISDLMQFSSNSVDLRLSKTEINLRELMNFSNNILKTLVECNDNKMVNIKTSMVIDDNIDNLTIISDENRLKQIILNFVSNAYKFTNSGSIVIRVNYYKELNNVVVSVEDSGLGIRKKDIHLIFGENIQLNFEKQYTNKGSGLGLSIAKTLANALNHKIGFETKYGKGSKFYIELQCSEKNKEIALHSSLIQENNKLLSKSKTFKLSKSNTKKSHNQNKTARTLKRNLSSKNFLNSIYNITENLNNDSSIINLNNQSINEISNANSSFKINNEKESSKSIRIPYLKINKNNDIIKIDEIMENSIDISFTKYEKILVVDDNQFIRNAMAKVIKNVLTDLKMNSYEIIELTDGIEILNEIMLDKNCKIKSVFADENMNFLNGSDAVKIIRKMEENNKIPYYHLVSVSGLEDNQSRTLLQNSGFDNIIPKPCSYSEIIKILNNPISD